MTDAVCPDVTVVTPSYNQGAFIEATIRSVLGQTGVHIEYLVMDGGSSDNTLEVLHRYRDRLHFVSEKDRGQTDAINKGLRCSRGRIVAYLNSDDCYLPGSVAKAVRFLDAHPEFAMVYGEGYHSDVEGRLVERYYTEPFDFARLSEICFICQPTVFFRRDLLRSVGYFDETLDFCMDYDYWIRVSKRYAVGYLSEYLAISKLHSEGKTLAHRTRFHQEILETIRRHYGRVPSRWVAAYAHAYVGAHLSRATRMRDLAFRLLVYSVFLTKYVRTNRTLPVKDFMTRLRTNGALQPEGVVG